MNLSALDLNLLVALEALLEEQSVSRAARRVNLSQPAMSHALNRLRNLLDDTLLVRAGARMQLTVRAEGLRYPVHGALERVRKLLTADVFDPATSQRTFRLFVADNAADLVLPPLWVRMQRLAPNIRVEVRPWRGRVGDPTEFARTMDAAIACVPDAFPAFYRQRLFTDHDACAIRQGNQVSRGIQNRKQFLSAKHVAVTPGGLAEDPVDTWLQEEGCKRNVVLSVPSYLQALHVVAASDLIAVIPARLARSYAKVLKLRVVAVPLDVGTFDEFLLHPARTHDDPGCIWFRRLLKEVGTSLDRA